MPLPSAPRGVGVGVAVMLLAAWFASLTSLLSWRFYPRSAWLALPAMAAMTFLYTGLFITAHDAMHGSVAPRHPWLNDALGRVAVFAFALFAFDGVRAEHHKHHARPASSEDPDFHPVAHPSFVGWYAGFLGHYVRLPQVLGLALAFNILHYGLGVPQLNLFAFWVAPPLLAATQLFYFGTYLPHREETSGYADVHRARSSPFSPLVSFLTCYHFGGFHHEHHRFPGVPWWRLPEARVPGDSGDSGAERGFRVHDPALLVVDDTLVRDGPGHQEVAP